jgi:hypothetical protein
MFPVYGTSSTPVLLALPNTPGAHVNASIMFMVFSIGSLLDPTNPAEAGEHTPGFQGTEKGNVVSSAAEQYHQLARIALSAGNSVVEEPTISGVRSIVRP